MQSYHFWRICREYKCFTFARYSPQCESSIIFATPHERPRMLTNTWRSFCDHCDWWRIAFVSPFAIYSPLSGEFAANIFFLHSQGYSPQCETSITDAIPRPSLPNKNVHENSSVHHHRTQGCTNIRDKHLIRLWALLDPSI